VVVGDAQQDKLYVQRFNRANSKEMFVPVGDLAVVDGQSWAQAQRGPVAITGPGVKKVQRWLPADPILPTDAGQEPSIAGLLAVGWERFQIGVRDDPLRLEPLYQRPSSAEEQWDRRAGTGPT
jgi:tRNA A37 threonylcarbamoyladenosine modification protein TsaB